MRYRVVHINNTIYYYHDTSAGRDLRESQRKNNNNSNVCIYREKKTTSLWEYELFGNREWGRIFTRTELITNPAGKKKKIKNEISRCVTARRAAGRRRQLILRHLIFIVRSMVRLGVVATRPFGPIHYITHTKRLRSPFRRRPHGAASSLCYTRTPISLETK